MPFSGWGETSPALLGGHIDAAMAQPGEVKPLVDAKKLRVLAVASPQRHPFFPEAPTGKEIGLGDGIGTWFVLTAPKDLEDQFVALVPVLAGEHVQPLKRRGLERLEAVAGEHGADGRESAFAPLELGGEEIAGPGRGVELLQGGHAAIVSEAIGSGQNTARGCLVLRHAARGTADQAHLARARSAALPRLLDATEESTQRHRRGDDNGRGGVTLTQVGATRRRWRVLHRCRRHPRCTWTSATCVKVDSGACLARLRAIATGPPFTRFRRVRRPQHDAAGQRPRPGARGHARLRSPHREQPGKRRGQPDPVGDLVQQHHTRMSDLPLGGHNQPTAPPCTLAHQKGALDLCSDTTSPSHP